MDNLWLPRRGVEDIEKRGLRQFANIAFDLLASSNAVATAAFGLPASSPQLSRGQGRGRSDTIADYRPTTVGCHSPCADRLRQAHAGGGRRKRQVQARVAHHGITVIIRDPTAVGCQRRLVAPRSNNDSIACRSQSSHSSGLTCPTALLDECVLQHGVEAGKEAVLSLQRYVAADRRGNVQVAQLPRPVIR